MRDVTPQPFTVKLRGGIELDIRAQTPEMACEQVARLHETLGKSIVQVRGPDDPEFSGVRGQCVKCKKWVLGDWRSTKVRCRMCKKGTSMPRSIEESVPRFERSEREGGVGGDKDVGGAGND